MSTPSRSHSSARGEEGYFEWIQVSSEPPRCQQPMNPYYNQEAVYPGDTSPPLDVHGAWPGEVPIPTHHAPREESLDSTQVS
ncbi:hypothetical protein AAG906_009607 [Vitis piasezkii]